MNRLYNYLKYIGIFLIVELLITFIVSILNLFGLKSGITSLVLFIFNIILLFILNYINAIGKTKKGYIEGLFLGLILIILMILIKVILINNTFNIASLLYYSILLIISILGGMFGKTKKVKE